MQYKNSSCFSANNYDSNSGLEIRKYLLSFITFQNVCCVVLPIVIYLILAMPSARQLLEQSMYTHMLIQIPLLTLCGAWIANTFINKNRVAIAYQYSLPLLILALTTAMYWMLPKSLDASLEHGVNELLKFISLPTMLGATFILGWKNIGAITKSFVITNLLSMLVVLAWLYIEAPIRLCNFYLVSEQKQVGMYILYVTATISVYWLVKLFVGNFNHRNISE